MVNATKKLFGSMFGDDVKNVLLQHTSWMTGTVIDQFVKGKLDPSLFPSLGADQYDNQIGRSCKTLIVFMIGGVTYEEAKEASLFDSLPSQAPL
jgi:hypothetical protein